MYANSIALFDAICPRRLNKMSRRLKRIGKEEVRYHKPFFDLKDTVDCKNEIYGSSANRVDHSMCVCILCSTKL